MFRCICRLVVLLCACSFFFNSQSQVMAATVLPEVVKSDEDFLNLLQNRTFLFFWNEANPETGLVKDRAANGEEKDEYTMSSIASVGFALPAYVIGAERGWVSEKDAYRRVLNTLKFFKDDIYNNNGFYYHFVDMNTGERTGSVELSTIDTALFLGGVLFVRQYYKDSDLDQGNKVYDLATELYERVNWPWMLDDGKTFTMGWKPNRKGGRFLPARWKHYDEAMLLYILGIGSPTTPVPADVWHNISRKIGRYGEHIAIQSPPLFTHQYSHTFVDFRDKHDDYADYFQNSVSATLANREFCIDQSVNFKTYAEDIWGLTACDGPSGYMAYGGKPGHAKHDGTVAPTAAGGSICFTPELSIKCLRNLYDNYKDDLWGRYGFYDSFNVDRKWVASDVIGIDQGTILLMIENYRTGLIWNYFMKNEEVVNAMDKIGFRPGTKKLEMPSMVTGNIKKTTKPIVLDGSLDEWSDAEVFDMNKRRFIEYGTKDDDADYSAELRFFWDEENLYVALDAVDNEGLFRKGGPAIYKNDCLELYFDPAGDDFLWGNKADIQLGLSPDPEKGSGKTWAWFQNVNPSANGDVKIASAATDNGYVMECSIKWSFIGVNPAAGDIVRFSPALHDVDPSDRSKLKLNALFQDVTGKDDKKEVATFTFTE